MYMHISRNNYNFLDNMVPDAQSKNAFENQPPSGKSQKRGLHVVLPASQGTN